MTLTDTRTPIADVLDRIDSHAIVDLGWCMVELRGAGYNGPAPAGLTWQQMADAIAARGLGGNLEPELFGGELFTAGYMLAGVIAAHLLGHAPGRLFHGRGSAYRADLTAIRAYEQERPANQGPTD